MTLTRWDPFNDLLRIQERMNQLFEDSLVRSRENTDELDGTGTWSPAVDIYETADRVVLVADLPGVHEEDLDVKVDNNTLILAGSRRLRKDIKGESFHCRERAHGSFQRSFNLPDGIRQAGIRAEHHNGVLEVTLPKAEGARSKRIHIETKTTE